MPTFNYKAIDDSGKQISDSLSAASEEEAAELLRAQNYKVIKIKPQTKGPQEITVRGKISTVDKANLCRYLGTMISSGLPLAEAVETIGRDTTNPTLKQILNRAQYGLQQGEPLSDIFERFPQHFDNVFIAIVRAGERSGSLNKSFTYLEEQLISSHELSQKVKGALIYPAVIISTMLGVGGVLIVFVVPQIAQVFLKTKLPIPRLTKIVLEGGLTLNQNLHIVGLVLGTLIVSVIVTLRTKRGKKFLLGFFKKIPGVSTMFEKLDLARFSRTLATLMQSGVPITESLNVATVTLSSARFSGLSAALKKDITKGATLASILREHHNHVPQMMISMINTGEKTGSIDKVLFDVAKFFEQELENEVKNFTAILEPVIMLVIGVGVGGMVLSVIAPIYSLVSSLQSLQ